MSCVCFSFASYSTGMTVRALLHENVIYCSTVSRPLVSVGQLKGMLDLRTMWGDSSPKITACSGGLRYILIEAAVFLTLPVITHQDLHALLGAIHDFTQTGTLYNAATWAKRLGRKLSLFHWSSPTCSLPQDHADFTEDPQVNFTSVCNSSSLRASDLPSTVQIVDLELDNPTTDDETTVTGDCNHNLYLASRAFYPASLLLLYPACMVYLASMMRSCLQWPQWNPRRLMMHWRMQKQCC